MRAGLHVTPRLGRGLVPSVLVDGVRLALVLVHGGVHEVDDVRADRRKEHRRELHLEPSTRS